MARQSSKLLISVAFFVVMQLTLVGQVFAGEYEDAFSRASELEEQGAYDEAAQQLRSLTQTYPQDYAVQLQLGWLFFQAEDYAAARTHYEKAYELSGGALDPTLGLGWTALRQSQLDEAREYFQQALEVDEDNASASEGLEAVGAREEQQALHISAFAGGTLRSYRTEAMRSVSWGPAFGVGVSRAGLAVGVTYRMFAYDIVAARTSGEGDSGSGQQSRNGQQDTQRFFQHEFYGAASFSRPAWGLSAHYAHVETGLDAGLDVDAVGLIGRYSPLGDVTLEASYSAFPDVELWRVAPAWRIPVGEGFFVRPSGAFQLAPGVDELFALGSLGVGFAGHVGSIEIGGKYGREWRPSYFFSPVVYNVDAVIDAGGWLSAGVWLHERWRFVANYAYEHYEAGFEGALEDGHVITVGIEFTSQRPEQDGD
ncbi:MAG: tetratricopeptide repeat protein [Myxococcota bacterium]